jgi:hypothetical protein
LFVVYFQNKLYSKILFISRVVVGKTEGGRPLEKPRRRWENNTEMDLREVGCDAWTGSIWLRIGTGGGLL